MLFGFFLTLGVGVLSIALRSFQNSYSQVRRLRILSPR